MTKQSNDSCDIFFRCLHYGMGMGNFGLPLAQAPRKGGVSDIIMRQRLADIGYDPIKSIGVHFSQPDFSDDLLTISAHLKRSFRGDPDKKDAVALDAVALVLRENCAERKLEQSVPTYRTPDCSGVFVLTSHIYELLQFFFKNPQAIEVALSTGEEDLSRPAPFAVESEYELWPIEELDFKRFFVNFPAFTKRAIALAKRGSSKDLEIMNPAVINSKIAKMLGIPVDIRTGELAALADQHAACAYAKVELAALQHVPNVTTILRRGLSRDMQGARWSNGVDAALSSLPLKWPVGSHEDQSCMA